jgi:hypothetical protein
MIIIKIMGGLGNQMFQYSLGRHLSIKNKTELRFDTSFYMTSNDRKFLLDKFNTKGSVASPEEVAKLKPNDVFSKLIIKYFPSASKHFIKEKSYEFDGKILSAPDNIYVEGYFPSEKYFRDIENIIREDLMVRNGLGTAGQTMMKTISEDCPTVSLHIRRGDYVTNEKFNRAHGLCPISYYENAITLIGQRLTNPHYIIFSDDIPWTKENLKLDVPHTFVDDGSIPDYEELILMSSCDNHIIANSTFSWWGAWLNPKSDKIVVAPKVWFADPKLDAKDLIPKSWLRI